MSVATHAFIYFEALYGRQNRIARININYFPIYNWLYGNKCWNIHFAICYVVELLKLRLDNSKKKKKMSINYHLQSDDSWLYVCGVSSSWVLHFNSIWQINKCTGLYEVVRLGRELMVKGNFPFFSMGF